MKYLITILFTLLISLGYSQTYFESPITENLTTQQVEQIDRTITIGDKFIVIKTVIDSISFDIQQLKINKIMEKVDNFGPNITYHCTSYDGRHPTTVIIYTEEKINEIHLIQPISNTEYIERYRFLID